MKKQERGITLVALVITVVLLSIIAGVTVRAISDKEFGMINKSREVVGKAEETTHEKEKAINNILEELNHDYITGGEGIGGESGVPSGKENILFSFTPNVVNRSGVTVNMTSKISGYTIEYQINGIGGNWTEGSSYIAKENCVIYARLKNKVGETSNQNAVANINTIDKVAPDIFELSVNSTTNSITIKGETTDKGSVGTGNSYIGIKGYQYKLGNGEWEPSTPTLSTTYTFTGLKQNTSYTVSMRAIDKAGNITEATNYDMAIMTEKVKDGEGNIIFTCQPTTAARSVTVKLSGPSGYGIKYQINSEGWQNYTQENSGFTVSINCAITARLVAEDGQEGSTVVRNVTNIDNVAPNEFNLSAEATENSITITGSTNDTAASGAAVGIAGIKGYQYKIDNGSWEPSTPTTQTSYTFSGLGEGTEHKVYMKAIDKAGNERIASNCNPNGYSITTQISKTVNEPVLATGMKPIKWDGSNWVETIAEDKEWYNYEEQTGTTEQPGSGTSKWANAKMPDGSMFVWIPRYAYQISSGYHTGGEGVKGVIDVVFIKDTSYTDFKGNANYGGATTAPTYSGDKQTNWIVHPVFRANTGWGGWTSELPGIWVAKFEATEKNGNTTTNSDGTTYQVQVLPNRISWRNITANNIFVVCQNATYGYSTKPNMIDSHMMKNTEWGAVAYLAHSKYGRNGTKLSINNASGSNSGVTVERYTTGYSGGTKINAGTSDPTYSYETSQGQLASTTGNIYGIYDMSGGAWEYVAGLYNSLSMTSQLRFILNAEAQYRNTYTTYSDSQYGDAVYETSKEEGDTANGAWYASYSAFVTFSNSIFGRGAPYDTVLTGGLFDFGSNTGDPTTKSSFRPVLVISIV